MQRIELNYGRGRLPVDLPDEVDLRVIRKRQMPVLPDPEAAVREALAAPTGALPLAELAKGKQSACILICDITRPVPNGLFLPILIEQLLDASLRP
jgi:lactate racemase